MRMLDVSDTGIRLIVVESLELNSEVEVEIESYGLKGIIKRLGYVRWQVKLETGQFCVGIEFQKCLNHRDWYNLVASY